MAKKIDRCWEFMRCNMQNECAAYPDYGEECWAYAGTKRSDSAEERLRKLEKIERRDLGSQRIQKKLCKYIERYGMCQCCPYYQYVERKMRELKLAKKFEW